jgi:hypothetical protein
MDEEQRKSYIHAIFTQLKFMARNENKAFDESVFFDLCFLGDKELLNIAKLCGVK